MLVRFGGFELDEEARILRAPAGEVALQPRVFDLLVFLIRNRDRVASKIDLVNSVWEGAFVTDSAVQRAMSVLRGVLRDGGLPDAIRTYSRQGYRFCADPVSSEVASGEGSAGDPRDEVQSAAPVLQTARQAFAAEQWGRAVETFRAADQAGGLSAGDLESWGMAAEYLGDLRQAVIPLERAVAAASSAGARCDAGRAALRLVNVQLERREVAVARGWLRRAERYLAGIDACHEAALLAWLRSRCALFTGDIESSLAHAERAYEVACRIGDADVEALSLLYRGLSLIALGQVHAGVELLDESAAAVLSERLRPWTGGIVYCGVIWACLNRGDWRRASEWTGQFQRWSSVNRVCGYPGLCQLHVAEILTLRGDLPNAEEEAAAGLAVLVDAIPAIEGDGHRVLGDVQLARGDFEAASASYGRAYELGWDPNPGLGLLQAAQGRLDTAVRTLQRALQGGDWSVRQRRGLLLSALAAVASRAGQLDCARTALSELDARPDLWETPSATAAVRQARGELALAEGDPASAVEQLEGALELWRQEGAALRMAEIRLRLAEALVASGDREEAAVEIDAADSVYAKFGVERMRERCRETARRLGLRPVSS